MRIKIKHYDDEYLTTLTNKGIVKRSYKDLESLSFSVENLGDSIKVSFDDISVVINTDLSDSTCTCPSRGICKHIITSVLYLNTKATMVDKTEILTADISEVLNADQSALLKIIGATLSKQLYADTLNNRTPKISKNDFILVEFDDGVKVRILTPISSSICSCKSRDICKHKALAILYFIASNGFLIEKKENDTTNKIDLVSISKFAKRVQNEICEILTVGLSRVSDNIIAHLEKLALSSHNLGLARLENSFRELSSMFNDYFDRSVHFSEDLLLKKLSDIYFLAKKLEIEENTEKLSKYMGNFRDEYVDKPEMTFIPIGERFVNTMSGYLGNVYYFLEYESKEVYSYSDIRPTFYDKQKSVYTPTTLMWNLNLTMESISKYRFTLKNPKISSDRRISSSSQIKGIINENLENDLPLTSDVITHDFRTLIKMENTIENDKVAFVMVHSILSCKFDSINQTFILEIGDMNDYPICIEINNTKENANTIKILQTFSNMKFEPTLFTGIVYAEGGKLKMIAIDFYKGFVPFDKREDNIC